AHSPRWVMWIFVCSGPLSLLGIEFGWVFACTGRQPWVIYRTMLTADAATRSAGLGTFFVLFLAVYLLLAITTILVFLRYFKRHPLSFEESAEGTSK
ncbi:cytochrome ubiquinol oxidase subunit I, partial [Microbacteriaceae bacterium K1510]|nr:cytochrome ubiquinol oxidase subunit I [Microbacteriaceae bacterium K1510]